MKLKHHGTLKQLRADIEASGHPIKSVEHRDQFERIITTHGAICDWHPSRGTVEFKGKDEKRKALETAYIRYLRRNGQQSGSGATKSSAAKPPASKPKRKPNKQIFVVHGHDLNALAEVELILHQLHLDPYVLMNTSGGGLTIIEALEHKIGLGHDQARFGIVLLTPDDYGFSVKGGEASARPRARQNVVMEMGMLISKLGRKNVAILKKGDLEIPSDAHGIIYLEFKEHVKEVAPKLCQRLREAGFDFSAEAVARASA